MQTDGTSELPLTPNVFTTYDFFLSDADGNPLFDTSDAVFSNSLPVILSEANIAGDLSILTSTLLTETELFFSGPNAVAANGGELVPLFAPPVLLPGTSVSYLDEFTFPNALLSPDGGPLGEAIREYTAVELGILADLGYTLAVPVPEPGSPFIGFLATLMLGGRRLRLDQPMN